MLLAWLIIEIIILILSAILYFIPSTKLLGKIIFAIWIISTIVLLLFNYLDKAPRTLSHKQQSRIVEKLKRFPGTTIVITTFPGEPECVAFSNVIADILVRAGWRLNPNNSKSSLLGSASGIVIVVGRQAGPKAEEKGKALVEALVSEGISAKLGYDSLRIAPVAIEIKIQVAKKS